MKMTEAIEMLRNLAGVMFWAMADLFLGAMWAALIFGLLIAVIDGVKNDDD